MQVFELLEQDYIELYKLLKIKGLCESGGIAKMLIAEGLVSVDGYVEQRKRCKIRAGQVVVFQQQKIQVI